MVIYLASRSAPGSLHLLMERCLDCKICRGSLLEKKLQLLLPSHREVFSFYKAKPFLLLDISCHVRNISSAQGTGASFHAL